MSAPYIIDDTRPIQLGLIVLQADETIEQDMRILMSPDVEYMVSRVRSGTSVTSDTLREMADNLTEAAGLLPRGAHMACVAYACTSGTAEIGTTRIADLVDAGVDTPCVTDPVTALIAACKHLGIKRLGLLSPYIESVSDRLRDVLAGAGIQVVAFTSFDEPIEERVVRITAQSIINSARDLGRDTELDAIFLSCTNLRTLSVIPEIEAARNMPVLSSNLVLAWHMAQLAQVPLAANLPFRLTTPATTPVVSFQ
ncbi:Asp/Glu racemase [Tateyamaria omphalii]|uniref:maleate cis-trans isomerase family protein n=1 Tax=Tateyamaria omphalii TaxID=299262 RepID=UPI0016758DB8|nr:aspartate/glutamate racemase family protein [Tateyamaria omphalii]GGX59199.1 Asp/Glu racemase [Tateyamaria omphalii]